MSAAKRAIMVDTETLNTATDAAITQIAAVVFDLDTGLIEVAPDGPGGSPGAPDLFNAYVKNGFGTINRSTVMWWMGQKHGAEFANRIERLGVGLREALHHFGGWLSENGRAGLPLYAHGAPFDFPVLRSSFEACELVPPWSYRDELCCRAFYKELPGGRPPAVAEPAGYAKHDALSDCLLQIAQLVEARRLLGLVKREAA